MESGWTGEAGNRRWIDGLSDEDLAFLRRFTLASGSLKAVAGQYGVSYPTIRLRLDRLIAKVQVLEDLTITDPFEKRVRAMYAEGRIDLGVLSELLDSHRTALET